MLVQIKKFQNINRKITFNTGNKLTIATGLNGTGKTVVTKLLYSLLKSASYKRYEPAVESVNKHIIQLFKQIRAHHRIELNLDNLDEIYGYIFEYMDLKEEFINGYPTVYEENYQEEFELIDRLIKIVMDDSTELHVSLLRTLLMDLFQEKPETGEIILKENEEEYCLNLTGYDFYDDNMLDYSEGFLCFDNVFYFDGSGTVLDYIDHASGVYGCEYNKFLKDKVYSDNTGLFDNEDLIYLEDELVKLLGGVFSFNNMGDVIFKPSGSNDSLSLSCVSGGVRSLSILYFMICNRHITRDSFIFLDELDNCLHPRLQLGFAEWLVKLIKKLGVHVYVNSKNPLFIEALEVFNIQQGLEDDTCYLVFDYNSDDEVMVKNIQRHDLFRLYDSLGNAYDIIDAVRIENIFR